MESTNKEVSYSIAPSSTRRYDIDWLRIMAVFLLFFFHTARIFYTWEDFYVYNDISSSTLSYLFIQSLAPWHMSLFFLLAGASTYFALRHRNRGQYVRERFKRLFLPFLILGFILIPPQSYLGLLNHSDYSQSFITWYPNFFTLHVDDMDGYYMGGYTWGHLWFIFHLFIYSLIAIPLFRYLNRESGRRVISWLARAFKKPGVIFLFPALLVLINEFPEIAGGNPLFYITFFICGFLLMSDHRFADTIDRYRFILLILGPVIFAGILVTSSTNSWPADMPNWADNMVDAYVDAFVPWFVILAMLAFGRRFLQFTNRFLRYFAEGAYPLYILHQTIILIIGFYAVQWDIAVAAKFAVIVTLSIASTILTYDLIVKRTAITRFLFGMKPRVKKIRPNKDSG
jgi:glucan biosynthesis protein C